MADDLLDAPATPEALFRLVEAGAIEPPLLTVAFATASATPSRATWRALLDRVLLVLGAMLGVAGVVFFFAFNWAKLAAFGKFGIIGAGIALAIAAAHRISLDRPVGKIAAVVAALLVGPLFAVFGQHYQTGADPYELFLAWAFLTIPWALAARSAPLWGALLVISDTGLALFSQQGLADDGYAKWRDGAGLLMVAALHLAAFVTIEVTEARKANPTARPETATRVLRAVVALVGMAAVSFGTLAWVFDQHDSVSFLLCGVATLAAWCAVPAVYWRRKDIAMLTIVGASFIGVSVIWFGKALSDTTREGVLVLFLTGFLLIAEIGALVTILRRLSSPHGRPDMSEEA